MSSVSSKKYQCKNRFCLNVTDVETNHFGSIYTPCRKCGKVGMSCIEPEGILLSIDGVRQLEEKRARLPVSFVVRRQKKEQERVFRKCGKNYKMYLEICFDDECGNSHNSFFITSSIYSSLNSTADRYCEGGGSNHSDIIKVFPEHKKYIKWHGFNTDGYCISNI